MRDFDVVDVAPLSNQIAQSTLKQSLTTYKEEMQEAEAAMLQCKRDALAELTEADSHSKKILEAKLKRQVGGGRVGGAVVVAVGGGAGRPGGGDMPARVHRSTDTLIHSHTSTQFIRATPANRTCVSKKSSARH